jgi:hypothetical protein
LLELDRAVGMEPFMELSRSKRRPSEQSAPLSRDPINCCGTNLELKGREMGIANLDELFDATPTAA